TFAPEKNMRVMAGGRPARVVVVEPTRACVGFLGTSETAWVPIAFLGPYVEALHGEMGEAPPRESDAALDHAEDWYRLLAAPPLEQEPARAFKQRLALAMSVTVRTVERQMLRFSRAPSPQGRLALKPGPETGSRRLSR